MAEKGFKRKLTAILSADVEGYSRLMGYDEEATVRPLTTYREVLTTLIQQLSGKVSVVVTPLNFGVNYEHITILNEVRILNKSPVPGFLILIEKTHRFGYKCT